MILPTVSNTRLFRILNLFRNGGGGEGGGWAQDSQMDWMGGRSDGLADYIHIEDRTGWFLQLLNMLCLMQGGRTTKNSKSVNVERTNSNNGKKMPF